MSDPVVFPDPIGAVRTFLLSVPAVTAITDRVATKIPEVYTFPLVRLTIIGSNVAVERRLERVHMQFDCYGTTDPEAALLARTVRAALVESGGYTTASAVLCGADGTAVLPLPDESFTPVANRWIATGNVYIRPNP
jgi:hypothetical protein